MNKRNQGIGLVLIVVGVLVLIGRSVDVGAVAWPLFVILPGVILLGAAFLGGEDATPLAIPGSIVTTIGLILFFQNVTDYFESWAYAWGLIVAAVGAGVFLQGALLHDERREREGMRIATIGLALFAAFGAFFEFLIFGDWGGSWVGRWLLPVALIAVGAVLLSRRGRGPEAR